MTEKEVNIRVPESLKDEIKVLAAQRHLSMKNWIKLQVERSSGSWGRGSPAMPPTRTEMDRNDPTNTNRRRNDQPKFNPD
jgi:hypothetical protein